MLEVCSEKCSVNLQSNTAGRVQGMCCVEQRELTTNLCADAPKAVNAPRAVLMTATCFWQILISGLIHLHADLGSLGADGAISG